MKKIKKIAISIASLSLAIIAIVGFWQKENIIALYQSKMYSSAELQEKLDTSKQNLNEELKDKYDLEVMDISAEDELKMMKGQMSLEDASKNIK